MESKEIMARNIKFQMAKKGVNQAELCSALGFKPMTVSDWLNAKTYPRIDKIEMMAAYFGISKADLIEDHASLADGDNSYYYDPETVSLAQFLKDHPKHRALLDACLDISPDEMSTLIKLVKTWKK